MAKVPSFRKKISAAHQTLYETSFSVMGVVYITRIGAHPAKAGFAPILVIYTTMMMKQYHFKHFYANLDFDHFS